METLDPDVVIGLVPFDREQLDAMQAAGDQAHDHAVAEHQVTAVAAFNDDTAATVLAVALDLGVRLPNDLAVMSHDDSLLATLYRSPLPHVRIAYRSIGHYMAEVALATARGARPDEISAPNSHAVPIHRGTT